MPGTYEFTRQFKKRLKSKPRMMQAAIMVCVERLMLNERHPGLRVHKMRGHTGIWEAYVDQGNRVTFERHGDHIVFRVNCNHDVLRSP